MKDDDDNDKVIDITDYVTSSKIDDELELEDFTSRFVDIYNQGIVDRQKRLAKEKFTYVIIHFLLLTQLLTITAVFIIFAKIYS
jgi:hypothetical protein